VPEGLEAEIWTQAAHRTLGRRIGRVVADERCVPPELAGALGGTTVTGVRRAGKIVVIDTTGPSVGLHFGMTGRLVVDGWAPIERLEYASALDDPAWDRLKVWSGRRTTPMIRFNDPRRLGHVSLDPDLSALGVDVFAVTPRRLRAALAGRRSALKPTLLDQSVVAGLGNMCADEVLWWSGLDPHRRVDSLDEAEVATLAATIKRRLSTMLRRGGSHTGVLSPAVRAACPVCPREGWPLRRSRVGGRTAVWCPGHQR
jgi:formamidopyrimidine-DNA glycosylase